MNNGKKNTEQSFFVDVPAEEKLAKSKPEVANDPDLANILWQLSLLSNVKTITEPLSE